MRNSKRCAILQWRYWNEILGCGYEPNQGQVEGPQPPPGQKAWYDIEDELEMSLDDFFLILCKFESKKSAVYSFIVNSGLKYRLAIFKLCQRFMKNEVFPDSFNLTTLVQLPKQGSQLNVNNSRFIHMKMWLPRHCESLAVQGMHRGKNDDWPVMSRPTDVLNDSFVCYQDLSEYVGLENIWQGFHGEPALKKHY